MKNSARSLLKNLVLFVPLAVITYVLLICILGTFAPGIVKNLSYQIGAYGHMHTRLKEARKTENIELLFLGSSHAYRGFDTRFFEQAGYSSFNLGSSSQTPVQTQLLLERYVDKLNPEIIIYEVNPSSFSSDGVESALDIISNDKLDLEVVKTVWRSKNIKLVNTLFFAAYRQFFGFDKNFEEPARKGKDTYRKGGFVEMDLEFYQNQAPQEITKWMPNPDQIRAFEQSINLIKSKNIKLLLVQAPVTRSYYHSISNTTAFDKMMHQYGEYYNFNNRLPLNDSLHFYDDHHLNQNGVKIFNDALLKTTLKQ